MTVSVSKNVGSYMNLPVNKQTITCLNMSHSKQFTTATFVDLQTIVYISDKTKVVTALLFVLKTNFLTSKYKGY
jgi:hypothetical protein